MSTSERYGRIVLALAVGLLFIAIFISMVSGELQTTFIIPIIGLGIVGYILMSRGRRT